MEPTSVDGGLVERYSSLSGSILSVRRWGNCSESDGCQRFFLDLTKREGRKSVSPKGTLLLCCDRSGGERRSVDAIKVRSVVGVGEN